MSPFLFLVYINALPQDIVSQVHLFADDTAINLLTLETEHGSDILQKDLGRLQAWESKWDIELNPSKRQVVRVTSSRTPFKTEYKLHGQVLMAVISTRYLVVDISNNLSWNTHVDRIALSANMSLGFVKRNLKTKSPKVRKMAYQTLVRLHAPGVTLQLYGTPTQKKLPLK